MEKFNPHSPDCKLNTDDNIINGEMYGKPYVDKDSNMSITEKAQYNMTNYDSHIGWMDKVIPAGKSITGHMFLEDGSALDKQVDGDHYKSMNIQPVEFIVANNIPYREANVIKYTCRHASKNGKKDIEKAIHYLEMILEEYK